MKSNILTFRQRDIPPSHLGIRSAEIIQKEYFEFPRVLQNLLVISIENDLNGAEFFRFYERKFWCVQHVNVERSFQLKRKYYMRSFLGIEMAVINGHARLRVFSLINWLKNCKNIVILRLNILHRHKNIEWEINLIFS